MAFRASNHVGTHKCILNYGALSLHAFALRPITSLCTLHPCRYRQRRNTQYPVPGQGFRGQDLPLADKAELGSAH